MRAISSMIGQPLKWSQPSLRMRYELRTGDELVARLDFRSDWGAMAAAESAEGNWTFKRVGFWQNRATIRVADAGDDLAVFTNNT